MCRDTRSAIPKLWNMRILCRDYPYTQTWASGYAGLVAHVIIEAASHSQNPDLML